MTDAIEAEPGPLLFIHGFGSCGTGNKAETLRDHYGSALISPDLPVEPDTCIEILESLISKHHPVATISSSLGSFYATWLNRKHSLPSILINPAVDAAKILKPHVGKHPHWCSGEILELTEEHIQQLELLKRQKIDETEKYLVLLQDQDEILDYRDAVRFYRGQQVIVEQGGNHRFENLQEYMTIIKLFIRQNTSQTTSQRIRT